MLYIDSFLLALADIKLAKDEKPPSKSPTAYSLFIREQYVISPKINGRDGFLARAKEVGAQWQLLSEEDRKVCVPSVPLSHPFAVAYRPDLRTHNLAVLREGEGAPCGVPCQPHGLVREHGPPPHYCVQQAAQGRQQEEGLLALRHPSYQATSLVHSVRPFFHFILFASLSFGSWR